MSSAPRELAFFIIDYSKKIVPTVKMNSTVDNDNITCVTLLLFNEFERVKTSMTQQDSDVVTMTPYVVLPISLVLLMFGHVIMRPSYAVIGFFMGILSTVHILHYAQDVIPCHVSIAITLAVGFSKAIASGFLIRASAVILGILSGFVITFSMVVAFPALDTAAAWPDGPIISGFRLFPAWASATCIGVVFGIVCYKKYKEVSIAITSIMGGYGFSWSVSLQVAMTHLSQMACFATMTMLGVAFQLAFRRYRLHKTKKAEPVARQLSIRDFSRRAGG